MKERLHWVDIAKGLMIVGMVANHIPNICNGNSINLSSFPWWIIGGAYGVFTMQSFFILSGYTSNFEQNTWTFLKKQVKGLLLPYLTFTIICTGFSYLKWGDAFIYTSFGEECFFLFDGFWFLTALFVAKVLAFFMHKLFKNKALLEVGGGILLLIIGIAISEYYSERPEPSHWHNWFHYRNGLCMTVFITLGSLLKNKKLIDRYGILITMVYCAAYLLFTFLPKYLFDPNSYIYFAAPCYTHYLSPNLSDVNGFLLIPSYLFYTTFGSMMIIWLSKKMGKNVLLEYLGRVSLVIYCVHFTILRLSAGLLSGFITTDGMLGAAAFFFIVGGITLLISAMIAWLFERRPLNYLIGKF